MTGWKLSRHLQLVRHSTQRKWQRCLRDRIGKFADSFVPRHLQTDWHMNNIRSRHYRAFAHHSLLHGGTTSNESLHQEINCWFNQTQQMHQAVLDLKLLVLQYGMLLSHNAAMCHPTSSQLNQATVLAQVASLEMWTLRQWQSWCSMNMDVNGIGKASLPINLTRQEQQRQVRAARKRQAHRQTRRLTVQKDDRLSRCKEKTGCGEEVCATRPCQRTRVLRFENDRQAYSHDGY